MTDVKSLQQKPESVSVSQPDLQCGLDDVIHGNFDDCMSFASCSLGRNVEGEEDDDDEGDHLVRRRRRSDLEGDDLAESSAARRRHSRILSRWVARQAEEMITTIERRNRETELMALAGLHTVSMLDCSFLRESQVQSSRRQGNVERPSTRASSVRQMWRELEDEHLLNHARERISERVRHDRSVDTNTDVSTITMSESRAGENQGSPEDASESERDFGVWSQDPVDNNNDDHNHSSREQSPDLGEIERERVRETVRGWMESGINDQSFNATGRNDNCRAEWLGENERERVRLVREWVQMATQQRGTRGRRSQDQFARVDSQDDHESDGLLEGQSGHNRRDMLRLRGRQALIDLLLRIERDRQMELQGLLEHRAVSDFAHRNRIQSLLRGRFLRSERTTENRSSPPVAASELLQLRQQHTVSGLREGFHSRLGATVHGQASNNSHSSSNLSHGYQNNMAQRRASVDVQVENSNQLQPRIQRTAENVLPGNDINLSGGTFSDSIPEEEAVARSDWQEEFAEGDQRNLPEANYADHDQWRGRHVDHASDHRQGSQGNHRAEDMLLQGQQVWHDDGSRAALGNWLERPSYPSRFRRGMLFRRFNRFNPPEDDNVYSMELRELVSRRSVSTLLRSGFRESLDQLIQSYVERRGRAPIDWDTHRNLSISDVGHHHEEAQREEQNTGDTNTRRVVPSPPEPPRQPLWQQDLHHTNWSRHGMNRPEFEWEMMNDLRMDVTRLQQCMNHMQRLLEACMDMQLELQRSVRQEVSAALNRSGGGQDAESSVDGSRWGQVKKGTCCICCDNHIDSLLYRCGHMCTCLKCANELIRGGGKCPLCRAPILEVVRPYSIL